MPIKMVPRKDSGEAFEGPGVELVDQFDVRVKIHRPHLYQHSMAATAPLMPPMLWTKSADGQTEEVRQLLAEGRDIEERGPEETSALHIGVLHKLHAVVLLLMEHGADVSATSRSGRTPLHYAAFVDCVEVARLLIEHGADVSAPDKDNRTPLDFAASQGSEDVARLLIDRGAYLQSSSKGGVAPEDVATMKGHLHIAAMLKAEAVRRDQCMAFAMGQQERLGAGSPVRGLDAGVVRMVLGEV